jgi:hypothetical protein
MGGSWTNQTDNVGHLYCASLLKQETVLKQKPPGIRVDEGRSLTCHTHSKLGRQEGAFAVSAVLST